MCCTVLRGTCFCARQHTLQHTKNGCVANFFATKTAIQATIFFDTNDNKFCNNVKKTQTKKEKTETLNLTCSLVTQTCVCQIQHTLQQYTKK